jgi:hypothetical protein
VPALPLPEKLKQYMIFSAERLADADYALDDGLCDDESFEDDEEDDSDD